MTYLKFALLIAAVSVIAGCSSSDQNILTGERLAFPSTATISGIYFVDAKTGFAATVEKEAYVTRDGGKTFSKLNLGPDCRAEDLYFLNDDIGFAFGRSGFLMRSEDGGKSWQSVSVDSAYDLHDMVFLDKEQGFVVGTTNSGELKNAGVIGSTTDKGLTWKFQVAEHVGYRKVSAVPNDNLWILGSGGIAYSTDRGASWEFNSVRGADTLRSFTFSDNVHGWSVGDKGLLRYSSDGGWSWKDQKQLTGRDLFSVVAPQLDIIYLAGDRFLGVSTNHGRSWLVDTLNYAVRFSDCQAVGKETFVAGSGGMIIRLKR